MLIISMTSYPKRIKYVAKAFASILMTKVDKSEYHCVLTLSKLEFPNLEKDLPVDLQNIISSGLVEVIWTEDNQKSHKKLMPTLAKYPNDPILIIDDDMYRTEKWLNAFIESHKKYPNDIIVGAFWKKFYIQNNRICEKICLNETYHTDRFANKIMKGYKPANGTGGTLYPPGTFTDKRFFDKELYMKLSPSSDETWQFCFNIIEDRKFRQLPLPFYDNFIEDSQKCAMNKNDNRYIEIYKNLFTTFPEFKEKLIKIVR